MSAKGTGGKLEHVFRVQGCAGVFAGVGDAFKARGTPDAAVFVVVLVDGERVGDYRVVRP